MLYSRKAFENIYKCVVQNAIVTQSFCICSYVFSPNGDD